MNVPHARPPDTPTDRQQAERQLYALYRDGLGVGEFIELRCLDARTTPAGKGPREFHRSITKLTERALVLRDQWDIYVGLGTRRCPLNNDITLCTCDKPGGADHVARLPVAWADIDIRTPDQPKKYFETLADALDALDAAAVPPSFVISTGHGLHAYWQLGEPTSDIARVVGVNRALAKAFHGDNATDPARILRLAGTFNHKHGDKLPVQIVRWPR